MRIPRLMISILLFTAAALAQPAQPTSFDQVVQRIAASEARFLQNLVRFSPVAETYIQNQRQDKDYGTAPSGDEYFLGRLDFSQGLQQKSMLKPAGLFTRMWRKASSVMSVEYLPLGFAQMIVIDGRGLTPNDYNFQFVRREFLGELRTLVIDVHPKENSGPGRFLGRIWVEDEDYNIVRFNGTFAPQTRAGAYLHFDSWRLNMQPGVWLPAYVYSEESNVRVKLVRKLNFKAQTRLWGYNFDPRGSNSEFSTMLVEADGVRDSSDAVQDFSPVSAQRMWERQAEDNVLDRLQRAGLLAPDGEVEKVLTQVLQNLVITNNLEIVPEVRARVLLTTPIESFNVGHTVVVSRGLLDVLPDEASLAAVLAHELAHIALGHKIDTKWAFSDRTIFPDEMTLRRMHFARDGEDERAADEKAMALLSNSPYKDKLATAGLFLRSIEDRAPDLPKLLKAHLGTRLIRGKDVRMGSLASQAPQLAVRDLAQIPSLPLGARIKLDPWSNRITMTKAKAVPLLSAREKMMFEVSPFRPHLTRIGAAEKLAAAQSAGGQQ